MERIIEDILKEHNHFYFFYLSFIFGMDILVWIFGNTAYFGATK